MSVKHSYIDKVSPFFIRCARWRLGHVLGCLQAGVAPREGHPEIPVFEVVADALSWPGRPDEADPASLEFFLKSADDFSRNVLQFGGRVECL